MLVLACACKQDPPPPRSDEPSEGELEARKIRETYRVVLADFHADVVAGRLDAAYARLAPMYRASVPLEKFSTVAKHPFFTNGVTFKIGKTSATQGTARVWATMQGPMGAGQIDMRCTAIDNAWKISGLSVDGASVLP